MDTLELSFNTLQSNQINYFCELVKTRTRKTRSNKEIIEGVVCMIASSYITIEHGGTINDEDFSWALSEFIESHV